VRGVDGVVTSGLGGTSGREMAVVLTVLARARMSYAASTVPRKSSPLVPHTVRFSHVCGFLLRSTLLPVNFAGREPLRYFETVFCSLSFWSEYDIASMTS
jgi:hypothetical protein